MNRYIVFIVLLLACFFPSQVHAESIIPCDVLIDVGHGGIDGGTSKDGILEKDINLAIAKKLYVQLSNDGFTTKLTRSVDIALSDENPSRFGSRHLRDLQRRKWIVNAVQPQLLISLHVNWSRKKNYRGPIVLHQQRNKESYRFAEIAQKHLNNLYGTQRRTVIGKTYFLLNRIQVPSVIVEMGFMSNPKDLALLKEEKTRERISQALGKAVKEYFQGKVPLNL
jgi:N-acetylmuramoyl-L-alanine amidase